MTPADNVSSTLGLTGSRADMDAPANLRPAAAVFVAGVSGILAGDVWLMARGMSPVTDCLRTRPGKCFLIALGGHVLDVWGPFDPFRAVAGVAGLVKGRT